MAETFHRELREHVGDRVTVFWHCGSWGTGGSPFLPVGSGIAQTTGILVEVGCDFVEVRGLVPLFEDFPGDVGRCIGPGADTLDVAIPLRHVCAVVESVPQENKAGFPAACAALDPPQTGRGAKTRG